MKALLNKALQRLNLKPSPHPSQPLSPATQAYLDRISQHNLKDAPVKLPNDLKSLDPNGPPMLEQLEAHSDQSQAGQQAMSELYRHPAVRQTLLQT